MDICKVSETSSKRLVGKVALVTGGGRGIGAGISQYFAAEGAKVLVVNRTPEKADEVVNNIRAAGGEAAACYTALGKPEQSQFCVEQCINIYGQLDIVIHNAGFCPWTNLAELEETTLEDTLAINLKTCFHLTKAALPHLEKSKAGRILVTSSTSAEGAMVGAVHYMASKAGVNGFVKGAAFELAPKNITVNAVAPGMTLRPGGRLGNDAAFRERLESFIPLGTLGRPSDIAATMAFLASDDARYITGQTITVDGGMLLAESGQAFDDYKVP